MGDECPIEKTGKCTKQYAQNARKNVKFHLSLMKADLFIAKNVIVVEDRNNEDIRLLS